MGSFLFCSCMVQSSGGLGRAHKPQATNPTGKLHVSTMGCCCVCVCVGGGGGSRSVYCLWAISFTSCFCSLLVLRRAHRRNDTALWAKKAIDAADGSRAITGNIAWQYGEHGKSAVAPGTALSNMLGVMGMSHQQTSKLTVRPLRGLLPPPSSRHFALWHAHSH
jgi:hypothetical protein